MKNWQIFEIDCLKFLKTENKNIVYIAKGDSDSTSSDIEVIDEDGSKYYIEAKMNKSQCGQFVLLKDDENKFYFSDKNKLKINKYSKLIIDYINIKGLGFINKKTIPLDISEDVISNYILKHYEEKNVKYIITKDKDKFCLIPLSKQHIINNFKLMATLRIKKSGSRKLSNILKEKIIELIPDIISIDKDTNNTMFKINREGDFIIDVDGYDIYFKYLENKNYIARVLSNTNNYCVIFTIKYRKLL